MNRSCSDVLSDHRTKIPSYLLAKHRLSFFDDTQEIGIFANISITRADVPSLDYTNGSGGNDDDNDYVDPGA